MKPYLKCPQCGQTDEFRVDVLMTGTWDAKAGFLSDLASPAVESESYIACLAEECDTDGTIKDFWVGDPDWMDARTYELFLADIHEQHGMSK
jgi:predicted nucleic-acid-binding Zn-ribbon protein